MKKPLLKGVSGILVLLCLSAVTESRRDWTPEFLSQTRKSKCILGNIQRNVTFLHGTDSGDFQKLGKVADMEVCVLLCCEMEKCQAAFMADRNCYAVKCHSQEHCVTAPARKNKWHPSVVFVKRINQSVNDKERHTAHARVQDKKNGTSKEHAEKEMATVQTNAVKEYQIPSSKVSDRLLSQGVMNSIIITDNSKPATVRLEETQQKIIPPLHKRKMAMRQEMFQKSKYSMVSAAVLTCSMAVLLSGVAVIAAKIRRRRELNEEHEYSTLQTTEE